MPEKMLIDSIKSINDCISYDDETKIFSIEQIDNWFKIAAEIKNLNFDYLMCITSIDLENDQLALAYNLHSTETKNSIELNLVFSKDAQIQSVESLWKTADWHEREAYDMMGIKFINHPDMKRILLPQDWEGYPLRKNYRVADYYHGMYIPKDKTSWE